MKVLIILFSLFIIISTACRKNKNHPVPSVATDVTIDINLPSYNALTGVGGWTYVNGGSRGLIVYRRAENDFIAFDRHSPSDPKGECDQPLYPTKENFLVLRDSCNEATFSLYDGSPISNSEFGLRLFQTAWNGSNLLRIFN
ncbi:MAG: hypothetical protein KJ941_06890 [Bacteroidetes bacterium]|nr:hypothetical protein [Bacteroidota bacterium]